MTGRPDGMLVVTAPGVGTFKVKRDMHAYEKTVMGTGNGGAT